MNSIVVGGAFASLCRRLSQMHPIRIVVLGYSSYILLGWLALCLPCMHQTPGIGWLDHLFIAASAVSTTGLATISTADSYNLAGEIVVLLLIQLGGLGYMTLGSFIVLSVSGSLSLTREKISTTALSLPAGFEVRPFLKVICWFTFGTELLGAALLYPVFISHHAENPLWQAVFHSISAFCTAGFGLFNNSFEDYRADLWLNTVISVLSYFGAIGFIVFADLWNSLTHKKARATQTTKVILVSTFCISAVGTVLFAINEPAIGNLPFFERWTAALFQVMTASTTVGFNTLPIGALSASSMFLLTLVMLIGASPSGTGGGIKTTSATALWASMTAVVRQRETVTFLNHEIPRTRLRAATANLIFYLLTLAGGIYALALVEAASLPDLMFEAASALGTVGLSRGITGALTPAGKVIIIILMWCGRIGPIVLGMALFKPALQRLHALQEEDIAI